MRLTFLVIIAILLSGCISESESDLSTYTIPEGFNLEIISQEPDLHAPVNFDFDDRGRIWVVEMTSYMPNIEGTGEKSNSNKIKILEDSNGDGKMDLSKVFLDNLTLPRSLLHAYGGLIYSEPPNLWFVEIVDDKPGERTLIDSTYAMEGNVEHMPSSLTLNIDNWIYSSTCNARYKRENGKWIKSFTTPRGQWGMTHDNYGRLIYNNNSELLKYDRTPPNALFKNKYLKLQKNIGETCSESQKVFPIQATAVNRGYQDGVLDENGFLTNTTSACSPVIYRNTNIPDWADAAFVCLPEINAIKKLKINQEGMSVGASFEEGKEYLISSDEGFRPVDLKVGPDGNIYIADMHRGIIQHKAYMTSYLREKILNKKLDSITEMGRILRLSPNVPLRVPVAFDVSKDPLSMLYSDNAFLRDKAQHYIVHHEMNVLVPALKQNIKKQNNEINLLHSLWTLEGLGAINEEILIDLIENRHIHVKYAALSLLAQMEDIDVSKVKESILKQLANINESSDFLIASFLNDLEVLSEFDKNAIFKIILNRNKENPYIVEAILSNLRSKNDIEAAKDFIKDGVSTIWSEGLTNLQKRVLEEKEVYYYNENIVLEDRRTVGMGLYRTNCAACHGVDGEGLAELAPSLIDSEYVSGLEDRLILLTLHGLSGPVRRKGKIQNFKGEMAGINNNDDLSDEDVKDILHFIRNAFATSGYTIQEDRISELRDRKPSAGGSFTESSLDSLLTLLSDESQ